MSKGLEEEDPFLLAILGRSEVDFCTYIERADSESLATLWKERLYMEALVSWPTGLRILTSTGSINDEKWLMNDLWHTAVEMGLLDSMEIMLYFANDVSLEDWYEANIFLGSHVARPSAKELERWSELLESLACRLLPHKDTGLCAGSLEVEDSERPCSVYHVTCLDLVAAKSAWRAGHRGLNSVKFEALGWFGEDHRGTPLWICSLGQHTGANALLEWLMDQGADPFWTHPILLTTPAHVFCRYLYITQSDAVRNLLVLKRHDGCSCHCSQGGCLAIASTILEHYLDHYPATDNVMSIFALVEGHRTSTWMSSAILRVLTFEELSLTHTCCYRIFEEVRRGFSRPEPEEAEVIYEHERDDIELLDGLVAEFEVRWATYKKPFATFMNRVWKTRMRVVLQEREMNEDVYAAELLKLGVVMEKTVELSQHVGANSDVATAT
jgi:hypothetical protein